MSFTPRSLLLPLSCVAFVSALFASPIVDGPIDILAVKPDCVGTPPACIKDTVCKKRGGECTTGGVHGEGGYWDGNADNCGCQL